MSRAFVKEDDGLVEFQEQERARKERLELLEMFEKKRQLLLDEGHTLNIPKKRRLDLLEKITAEIRQLKSKLDPETREV